MKIAETVVQSLLAVQMLFAGANKFGQWMEPQLGGDAPALMEGLIAAKFVMPTVAIVEVLAGILLITGKAKAFTYMLLLPIVFGMLAFHIVGNDLENIGGAAMVALLYLVLIALNKQNLISLFK